MRRLFFLLLLALMVGCGGGGGGGGTSVAQVPVNTAITTVTAANDGKTAAAVTMATPDGSSTVIIPQGTALYADAAKTQPVSGTLTVSTTTLATVSALPTAAQTGTLVGVGTVLDSVVAVADITITNGTTTVTAFGSPITVNLKLPAGYAAVGSSVDYYSFDATGTWTKEGTAMVKADNSIDMTVTHLSGWGVADFESGTATGEGNTAPLFVGTWRSSATLTSTGCPGQTTGNSLLGNVPLLITQTSGNVLTFDLQGIPWGTEGATAPLTGTVSGYSFSGSYNQPAPANSWCPTCSWTITLNMTIEPSGNYMTGTLVKTGNGGDCSYSATMTSLKQ